MPIKRNAIPGTVGASLSKMTNTLHKFFSSKATIPTTSLCVLGKNCTYDATDTCDCCHKRGCSYHSDTLCPHFCQFGMTDNSHGHCGNTETLIRRCANCSITLCISHTMSSCPHLNNDSAACIFAGCLAPRDGSSLLTCQTCAKPLCRDHGNSTCPHESLWDIPHSPPSQCAFMLSNLPDGPVTCLDTETRMCRVKDCAKTLCRRHYDSPCSHVALCSVCNKHSEVMTYCTKTFEALSCDKFLCRDHVSSPCPHTGESQLLNILCGILGTNGQRFCPRPVLASSTCLTCSLSICDIHMLIPCPHRGG